ncbi:unnamed protein product [Plutella xylostella]|uniref:(diamondback moth) hypothetical protein n=1 Tax=Plutella xylostella TaxID=51655 RepID=A0A8S4E326_PLUXY|nr:unnamed protein product [Plutella xylostella]
MSTRRSPPPVPKSSKTLPGPKDPLPERYDSAPNLSTEPHTAINTRSKRKRETDLDMQAIMTEIKDMFSSLSLEQNKRISNIQTSMSNIEKQNEEITSSIKFLSEKYDEFFERVKKLESEKTDDIKRIHILEDKVEFLERKLRSSGIEVRNVPKRVQDKQETKEDLCQIIKDMGKTLEVGLNDSDIKDVYRINSRSVEKPIIVEFCSTLTKEKIVASAKKFNKGKTLHEKLNTGHLNFKEKKPVFVSESLTPRTQKLFYIAREFSKANGYSFCWTSRGTVFLRKSENMPQIRIEHESELNNLIKSK